MNSGNKDTYTDLVLGVRDSLGLTDEECAKYMIISNSSFSRKKNLKDRHFNDRDISVFLTAIEKALR